MHMASQVTESVQTSPFEGAETMFFPVPYRITNRSSASLRQPGKYTKATGGNGGWNGDVSHQSFLEPKYPSLYGILCIFRYWCIRPDLFSYIQRALLCFRLQRYVTITSTEHLFQNL